jgi:predicted patatin/cPLA2 family phospholipase
MLGGVAALCRLRGQRCADCGGRDIIMRKLLSFSMLVIGTVILGACSYPERGPGVPLTDTTRALPLGLANARFFADGDPKPMMEEAARAYERQESTRRSEGGPARPPPVYYLAISGGGDDGAFGTGLLNGWAAAGTRPQFNFVTGVSTGALIAPLAFLGADYDDAMARMYTTLTPDRVFRERWITAAVFDDAMADTSPLAQVIAGYADQKMLDAIAREYQKGRLLLIGTTDLDAQRPVIWNIGAIAASGHPGGLELFRKILRASSAVPGVFQPVMVDVEIDGHKYQEMHVDGGTVAQLFVYPASIDISKSGIRRERHAYIIRNGRLDPDYATSKRQTLSVAGRAISTMMTSSGKNDVLRTYLLAQRDGIDYNLAYIGSDFRTTSSAPFEPAYMRALYTYGFEQGRDGRAWHKLPPQLEH